MHDDERELIINGISGILCLIFMMAGLIFTVRGDLTRLIGFYSFAYLCIQINRKR